MSPCNHWGVVGPRHPECRPCLAVTPCPSCARAEGLPGNMCSADEECVSAFGKDVPWLAERSGKGDASSPERQSRAQQGHGDRGRTLHCVGSGQRRPWLARGTPSRGVSSSYQLSLKRLSLWTSNSCPYLGPAQALIGFWNNSSPGCWEPGWASHTPSPQALLSLGREHVGGCPPKPFQAGQGRERNPAQGPGWSNEPVQGPRCLLYSRVLGSKGFWGPWDPTQAYSESTAIHLGLQGGRGVCREKRPGAPKNHPRSTRTSSPLGPSGRMGWWTGSPG